LEEGISAFLQIIFYFAIFGKMDNYFFVTLYFLMHDEII